MSALFFLVCQNPKCGQNIWLPASKRPGISCDQSPWPKDGNSQNFSCPVCRFATAYKAEELRCDPAPLTDLSRLLEGAILVCTETVCGHQGCKAPLRILSVTTSPSGVSVPDFSIFLNATAANLRCTKGHALSGSGSPAGSFAPCIDDREWDW
jgi:hypothetical protein